MKTGFKYVVIAFLLLAGAGNAFAGPFSRGFGGHNARQSRAAAQQDERQAAPPEARGAMLPPGGPREPFAGPNAPNRPPGPQQMHRMGGRMTVEERQALRRQINEAGHDIYAPKK